MLGVKQVAIDRRTENPIFGDGVLAIFDVGWCRKRPRAGALGGATKFGKFTETAEHGAVAALLVFPELPAGRAVVECQDIGPADRVALRVLFKYSGLRRQLADRLLDDRDQNTPRLLGIPAVEHIGPPLAHPLDERVVLAVVQLALERGEGIVTATIDRRAGQKDFKDQSHVKHVQGLVAHQTQRLEFIRRLPRRARP